MQVTILEYLYTQGNKNKMSLNFNGLSLKNNTTKNTCYERISWHFVNIPKVDKLSRTHYL